VSSFLKPVCALEFQDFEVKDEVNVKIVIERQANVFQMQGISQAKSNQQSANSNQPKKQ